MLITKKFFKQLFSQASFKVLTFLPLSNEMNVDRHFTNISAKYPSFEDLKVVTYKKTAIS